MSEIRAPKPAANVANASHSPIQSAREYVQSRVQAPALASALPDEMKSKVRNANLWLSKFNRVGDLLAYLKRFEVDENDPVYKAMKEQKLLTFEDIVLDFEKQFEFWSNDCSRPSDFVVGNEYSAFDILILARNYDTRAGGMFVLKADGAPIAVVIKATLAGGKYPNKWVAEPTRLKYYLKSIRRGDKDIFGEHFEANKAIIETPNIPIVTFTRITETAPFVFRGMFRYVEILREELEVKAFILELSTDASKGNVVASEYLTDTLAKAVLNSENSTREARLRRLANASGVPSAVKIVTTAYTRNADVIVEVLHRAAGHCENCLEPAPFIRAKDGSPFLEVHHRIQLAKNGKDTVENAIALCPNCHREMHFGVKFPESAGDPVKSLVISAEELE